MKKLLLLVMAVVMVGCIFSPFPRTPAVPARINTYKKAVARWGPEAKLVKYNTGEVTGIWSEGKQVVALGGEFSCMWHVSAKEQRQYEVRGPFLDFGGKPTERTLLFDANGTVRGGSFMMLVQPLF